MTRICVIGLGYIGLPTSALFANEGYEVVGVDVNEKVVQRINEGVIHIEEPGLDEMVEKAVASGRLTASTEPTEADYFIIAVPTPIYEDKTANLDYVVQATKNLLPKLQKGNTVIVESTIPPRTISDVVAPIVREHGFNPDENDVYLAHCPERVIPGNIVYELKHNHRIVGGYTSEAAEQAAKIYENSVDGDVRKTDAVVAEMSKLMENTFRDVNIALANELSKIADDLTIDASKVIEMANMHPRVNILQPGPGVGGHCIPVDPYFIIEKAQESSPLMQTARRINDSMPQFVLDKINKLTEGIDSPKIALLGLTYKGNTSDMRESPALDIIKLLEEKAPGVEFKCHDPYVELEDHSFEHQLYTLEDALADADLAVVLADHQEFKEVMASTFTDNMKTPTILDTRNVYGESFFGVTVHSLTNLVNV
ncbi:nucleotide sugar dehydrogenase [Alkalibacillus aidingensis]|uniref:nucleotide sugar dehydrogenase n=1 Tax=Alkalibacillus aidingensis TaxID=2747607 RepID=UPI0016603B68|nr:nucleotide sugar dehydrogenase [Alkalibacillus aidingensis]